MRAAYSILRELVRKEYVPGHADYGLKKVEFEGLIRLLEKKGCLQRVLWANDAFSLKPAQVMALGNFIEIKKAVWCIWTMKPKCSGVEYSLHSRREVTANGWWYTE